MAEKTKAKLTAPSAVILGHISDIHFRKRVSDGAYSVDDDLRRELQNALGEIADELGAMHGILITGDIAFAGAEEEYEAAYTWIRDLCKRTGCPEELVRTISGNHDVLRAAITDSRHLQNAHAALRRQGAAQQFADIDQHIAALLSDKAAPELLFSSLQKYNDFAGKFFSGFEAAHPFWQQDVVLNDRSILRIRGLNSALVSNAHDNLGDNKLVLGSAFCLLPREDGVEYLVMCHHPPQWLWDQAPIEDYLATRARIVLFGHRHVQRIDKTVRDGHEVLRVYAGALNPDPNEPRYEPTFNCLRLLVRKEENHRILQVKIYSRIWSDEKTRFIPIQAGAEGCETFELKLPQWDDKHLAPDIVAAAGAVREPTDVVSDPLTVTSTDAKEARLLSAPRRLAYRFMALPYHLRLETAQKLNLISDDDRGQSDMELFRRFFRRAAERSQLAALWEETERRHADGRPHDNPFTTT